MAKDWNREKQCPIMCCFLHGISLMMRKSVGPCSSPLICGHSGGGNTTFLFEDRCSCCNDPHVTRQLEGLNLSNESLWKVALLKHKNTSNEKALIRPSMAPVSVTSKQARAGLNLIPRATVGDQPAKSR